MRFTNRRYDIPDHPVIAAMEGLGYVPRRSGWTTDKDRVTVGDDWNSGRTQLAPTGCAGGDLEE